MLDRFLVYQRSAILVGTFLILALNGLSHLTDQAMPWLDALTIVVSLSFSLYNALFVINWHHISDRLVREVQKWRSQHNQPSLPSKQVWQMQKLASFVGMVFGLMVASLALLGLISRVAF
jgi:hypothetical protein